MLASMLFGAAPVAAQQPTQSSATAEVPEIITSGTAEARVTPDRAQIFMGVQTRAATAAQAGTDNARKTRAVIDAVKARGIPAAQIATSDYNLYPEYDHREPPREGPQTPRVIGYVATNTVRIEVRQLDQVGGIIDAGLAAGANMVNTIQFFASNVDAARRAALAEAVSRARGDAEALAKAAGGSLGRLLELNTQSPPVRPLVMERAMRMDAGGAVAAANTPIEPGQQTFTVWVSGRWSLIGSGVTGGSNPR
jgi:uncharacterized protein YggE